MPAVFDNYEVNAYHRGEEVNLRLWDKAASDDDGASLQNCDPSRRLSAIRRAWFSISAISFRTHSIRVLTRVLRAPHCPVVPGHRCGVVVFLCGEPVELRQRAEPGTTSFVLLYSLQVCGGPVNFAHED